MSGARKGESGSGNAGLMITFGLVPLIGIGATLLYDHYYSRLLDGAQTSIDEQDEILHQISM